MSDVFFAFTLRENILAILGNLQLSPFIGDLKAAAKEESSKAKLKYLAGKPVGFV
mgnify:CR=1 FL=1